MMGGTRQASLRWRRERVAKNQGLLTDARVAKSADAKDLKVRSGQSLFRATFETVRAWRNRQTHRT